MTFVSKGYVQKSRYFFNSEFKNVQVDRLLHLSKTEAKRHFLQGMEFANKVDGRSYAHVLSGGTAWEGVQDVGSNPVSSSCLARKNIKKCSSIPKKLFVHSNGETISGKHFKYFKTSVEHTLLYWTFRHCDTSSHTNLGH